MSTVLIINASPRQEGTSNMLAKRCLDYLGGEVKQLYSDKNNMKGLLQKIGQVDTVIISGPCYINTYPAQVTYLLEQIAIHPEICHKQKVYGIINGGMPYVHTHESGVSMLKLFCQDCNMDYKGSFVLGGGAMLDGSSLEKHVGAKKIVPAFNTFLENIKQGKASPDQVYLHAEYKIPRIITRFLVLAMNKSIDKKLRTHGFEPNQSSPYWK